MARYRRRSTGAGGASRWASRALVARHRRRRRGGGVREQHRHPDTTADKPTPTQAAAPDAASRGEPRGQDAGRCRRPSRPRRRRPPRPRPSCRRRCSRRVTTAPTPRWRSRASPASRNYVVGDQPKFTMVVTNIGLVACKRDVGAAVLAAYVYGAGQQPAVVEPRLRTVQRDAGQDVQPGRAGDHRGDLDRDGLGAATARCRVSRSGRAPTTWSCSWAICGRRRCRSSSPRPRACVRRRHRRGRAARRAGTCAAGRLSR